MRIRTVVCCICCLLTLSVFAQEYRLEGNEVKIAQEIQFKTGMAELLPVSEAALLIIKKYLDDKPYISILRVEVHTDNSGDAAASQTLSEKRADAITDRLVALGVDCNRLLPAGFGGTRPVADNSTAAAGLKTGGPVL